MYVIFSLRRGKEKLFTSVTSDVFLVLPDCIFYIKIKLQHVNVIIKELDVIKH